MSYELRKNELLGQYEFKIEGHVAKLEYKQNTKSQIFLTHIEVPKALEGKGIAAELTRQALEDIKENEIKLIPTCPYVATYIRKNPEWKSILLKGINI